MQEFSFKVMEDETFAVTGYTGDEKEVVIPDTHWGKPVTVLFDSLFSGHAEIERVRIPDTVTDIGEFVFDGCRNLRQIGLPAGLEHIWPYAFARSGLEEIVIPEKIRTIAPFTFKDCKNLRRFICNKNLRKICAWAFHGCSSLTDFSASESTEISPEAFKEKELISYNRRRMSPDSAK